MNTKETMGYDKNNKLACICVNSDETIIYGLTKQGQIIYTELDIATYHEYEEDNIVFKYLISQFHRSEITGLDICTRR